MPFPVKSKQRFVLIGDSITDCGRREKSFPLGSGYVSQFVESFTAAYPERDVTFINRGIGGNTIKDLQLRWSDDLIAEKPDWVSVMIGINDLHCTMSGKDKSVNPEEFAKIYDRLLARVRKETKAKIVLLDPFYMSKESKPGWWRERILKMLKSYIRVVDRMVKKYDTGHVKTHAVFQKQLKYRTSSELGPEPVHPYHIGHTIISHHLFQCISQMK